MTNEASVTRDFKHYLEKNLPTKCTTWEFKIIKLDKKKSFAFNSVQPHQVEYLLASLRGFYFKIPDTSAINGFSSPKPFDSVYIKAKHSYVVPIFYLPRKIKTAVLIPIKDFIKIRDTHPKKSIHLEELSEYSQIQI